MTQQLSSLSGWLPISFYSNCVITTGEGGGEENGPQSRLFGFQFPSYESGYRD